MVPSVIFADSRAGMFGYTAYAFNTYDAGNPALNWIKYNRERIAYETLFNSLPIPNWSNYYLQGITGEYKANATAVVVGNADPGDFKVTNYAKTYLINGTSYTAKIAPRITGLSVNTGSTAGGHRLMITGNSFSPTCTDNTVTIDGQECLPEHCGFNFIQCITSSKSAASDTSI